MSTLTEWEDLLCVWSVGHPGTYPTRGPLRLPVTQSSPEMEQTSRLSLTAPVEALVTPETFGPLGNKELQRKRDLSAPPHSPVHHVPSPFSRYPLLDGGRSDG